MEPSRTTRIRYLKSFCNSRWILYRKDGLGYQRLKDRQVALPVLSDLARHYLREKFLTLCQAMTGLSETSKQQARIEHCWLLFLGLDVWARLLFSSSAYDTSARWGIGRMSGEKIVLTAEFSTDIEHVINFIWSSSIRRDPDSFHHAMARLVTLHGNDGEGIR